MAVSRAPLEQLARRFSSNPVAHSGSQELPLVSQPLLPVMEYPSHVPSEAAFAGRVVASHPFAEQTASAVT